MLRLPAGSKAACTCCVLLRHLPALCAKVHNDFSDYLSLMWVDKCSARCGASLVGLVPLPGPPLSSATAPVKLWLAGWLGCSLLLGSGGFSPLCAGCAGRQEGARSARAAGGGMTVVRLHFMTYSSDGRCGSCRCIALMCPVFMGCRPHVLV